MQPVPYSRTEESEFMLGECELTAKAFLKGNDHELILGLLQTISMEHGGGVIFRRHG